MGLLHFYLLKGWYNMYYIGIDPGFSGAIAVTDKSGKAVLVMDMPVLTVPASDPKHKVHKYIDTLEIYKTLKPFKKAKALIERVHSRPSDSHVGAFAFGKAYGAICSVVDVLKIERLGVTPIAWKTAMKLNSDKSLSLKMAREIYPESACYLKRMQDDGRAEALLLCSYLRVLLKSS